MSRRNEKRKEREEKEEKESILEGYCFCISGSLSIPRKEIEEMILRNGGELSKTVSNKTTHLLSSNNSTKKCLEAQRKGIEVVDEDWMRNVIDMKEKKKSKKSETVSNERRSEENNGSLNGLVFAISGSVSVSRKEFESFIVSNGGKVSKTVTNKVTHLVSSESNSKKCQDAEEKGIEIVDEDWVREKVEEEDSDDENSENDNDDDNNENEEIEGINEKYEPQQTNYPITNIFEQEFLNNFWSVERDQNITGSEVTNKMIFMCEKKLGFKLPQSFIEFVRFRNGGYPRHCQYLIEKKKYPIEICELFGIDKKIEYSLIGGMGSEFWMNEWEYPRIGVYFASCPSGGHDMLCLDYRDCGVDGEPKVVHVDQEMDYKSVLVANNFEEFVRGLRTYEVDY